VKEISMNSTDTMRRLASMTVKQKTNFFIVLCFVSFLMLILSVCAAGHAITKWKNFHRLSEEQSEWMGKSHEIETDLAKLSAASEKMRGLSAVEAQGAVSEVASQVGTDYTLMLSNGGNTNFDRLTISRLRIVFEAISLAQLIDFCDSVESLDDSLAISEIRIKARSGGLVSAHCVISILGTK
jgi:hypothetical protein